MLKWKQTSDKWECGSFLIHAGDSFLVTDAETVIGCYTTLDDAKREVEFLIMAIIKTHLYEVTKLTECFEEPTNEI